MTNEDDKRPVEQVIFCIITFIVGLLMGLAINTGKQEKVESNYLTNTQVNLLGDYRIVGSTIVPINSNITYREGGEIVYAYTTGYNTVEYQTDSTPCIAANGMNICGLTNIVACPTYVALGTWVKIDDNYYLCADRTNTKYNGRFDISFDKDVEAALLHGIQLKKIEILN